jgi:hypothetical protein
VDREYSISLECQRKHAFWSISFLISYFRERMPRVIANSINLYAVFQYITRTMLVQQVQQAYILHERLSRMVLLIVYSLSDSSK